MSIKTIDYHTVLSSSEKDLYFNVLTDEIRRRSIFRNQSQSRLQDCQNFIDILNKLAKEVEDEEKLRIIRAKLIKHIPLIVFKKKKNTKLLIEKKIKILEKGQNAHKLISQMTIGPFDNTDQEVVKKYGEILELKIKSLKSECDTKNKKRETNLTQLQSIKIYNNLFKQLITEQTKLKIKDYHGSLFKKQNRSGEMPVSPTRLITNLFYLLGVPLTEESIIINLKS